MPVRLLRRSSCIFTSSVTASSSCDSWRICIRSHTSACQHTSAYVSIRQHTSAYVSRGPVGYVTRGWSLRASRRRACGCRPAPLAYVSIRCLPYAQDTSVYVSLRQSTSAYVDILRHTCPASSFPPHSRPDRMWMSWRPWSVCQTWWQLELGTTKLSHPRCRQSPT